MTETISFREPHWFGVDVDHDGRPYGIELFSRDEVFARLKEQVAPGTFIDV